MKRTWRVASASRIEASSIVAALCVLGACGSGADADPAWGVKLGWTGAMALVVDGDDNATVALDAGDGKTSMIMQLDHAGVRRFTQRLDFGAWGLAAAPEQTFVVVGTSSPLDGSVQAVVTRIDGRKQVWTTTLSAEPEGGVESGLLARYVVVGDKGIFVAGQESRRATDNSVPNPETIERPFLARLDLDGDVLWQHTLGQSALYAMGLVRGADGGVVLGARLNAGSLDVAGEHFEGSDHATLLIGFADDGQPSFVREVGESGDDELASLSRGADGTLYAAGTHTRHDLAITANGVFVAATSSEGELLFRAELEQGFQMDEPRVAERGGGAGAGAVVVSNYADEGGGGVVLAELDDHGDVQERRVLEDARFVTAVATRRGGVLLLGGFQEAIDVGTVHLTTSQPYDSFLVYLPD